VKLHNDLNTLTTERPGSVSQRLGGIICTSTQSLQTITTTASKDFDDLSSNAHPTKVAKCICPSLALVDPCQMMGHRRGENKSIEKRTRF
uniref:Uncharacterized protein n=1 Tax=Megaselia scalaris TaxID=36166 RepID=T1GZU9_MEGSC